MAHALIGSIVEAALSFGTAPTVTKTGVTAGDGLICIITWEGLASNPITSVTCPGETVDYTPMGGGYVSDVANVEFASIKNVAASGSKTITVNLSSAPSGGTRLYLLEFSGQNTSEWLDTQGVSGSGSLILPGTADNDLVLGVCGSVVGEPVQSSPSGSVSIPMTNDTWYKHGGYKLDYGAPAGNETISFSPSGRIWGSLWKPAGGPVLTKKARGVLVDRNGTPRASLSGLKWAWFDQPLPQNFAAPVLKGSAETTAADGTIEIVLTGTSLAAGAAGFLLVSNGDGDPDQDPAPFAFAQAVEVIEE